MTFAPYPKYKDSGEEWLGQVPAHWGGLLGRRLFSQIREPAAEMDEQLSATQKYGVVPQRLFMELEDQKLTLALSGLDNFKHVEKDDFVISLRSFQGGIERSAYSGCVSPAYTVLRSKHSFVPAYWTHLLKSSGYISALQSVTSGIRDGKNISYEQFGSVALPTPPVDEQETIAAFLDHETARIDRLIAKQERLIELLKEKRQAVISHAVTKGLDPTAPMKDSGVDWLGQVPEHWGRSRIKYVSTHIVDCLHTTPTYEGELRYPAIRTADISRGKVHLEGVRLVSEEIYLERIQRLKPKFRDVLYSREGERFGLAAMVPEGVDLCLGQRMMMFRIKVTDHPEYVMWALNSETVFQQVLEGVMGATSPHVNIADIRNFHIPAPPVDEQIKIANHIQRSVDEIDDLSFKASSAIELMKEHRTALIAAAVTGKIDVRGWRAPAGQVEAGAA